MKRGEKIVVYQLLNASVQEVWSALTNLTKMKQWYFENIDHFQAEIGSTSQFQVCSGERTFTHLWEIIQVESPLKICYSWKYKEYPGDSIVCFNLSDLGKSTRLFLTVTILEDFPDDIPEFKNESCQAGWNYFLGERLTAFLKIKRSKNNE